MCKIIYNAALRHYLKPINISESTLKALLAVETCDAVMLY